MSYTARKEVLDRDGRYQNLVDRKTQIQNQVQSWVDEATSLHGITVDTTEKTEIIALRDAFVATLAASLGV